MRGLQGAERVITHGRHTYVPPEAARHAQEEHRLHAVAVRCVAVLLPVRMGEGDVRIDGRSAPVASSGHHGKYRKRMDAAIHGMVQRHGGMHACTRCPPPCRMALWKLNSTGGWKSWMLWCYGRMRGKWRNCACSTHAGCAAAIVQHALVMQAGTRSTGLAGLASASHLGAVRMVVAAALRMRCQRELGL